MDAEKIDPKDLPTYKNEYVTPTLAAEWLKKNTNNRKEKKAAIAKYSRDMKAGRWHVGPDMVAFDKNGVLSNGQNRLLAIIDSGKSEWMGVMYGCEQFPEMDQGCVRDIADQIRIATEKADITKTVVSDLRLIHYLACNGGTPTAGEIINLATYYGAALDTVYGFQNISNIYSPVRTALILGIGELGISAATCERFYDVVRSGFSESPDEKAAIVYKKFIDKSKRVRNGKTERMHATRIGCAELAAFNKKSRAERLLKPMDLDLAHLKAVIEAE